MALTGHIKTTSKNGARNCPKKVKFINGDTYVHWYECITDYVI